jgi:hypothetical protein
VTRLVVALAAALALTGLARGAEPQRPPARIQVVAEEYSFALSRRTIMSGRAAIELTNFGQDPHDLHLRRLAPGAPTLKLPQVRPGQQAELRVRLAPGRFVLWCSLADHRARGMEARLTVAKRR